MLAGGTAGVAMWSVAIPPDVSSESSESARRDDEVVESWGGYNPEAGIKANGG